MITKRMKERILAAVRENRSNYPSDARHAASLGIATSVYSDLKNGKTDRVLSDANWLQLSRRLGVAMEEERAWKAAKTATFEYIMAQLGFCQENAFSSILCDVPNIGKTFTARHYAMGHRNVAYVDCSQVKLRGLLVRRLAREFGLSDKGHLTEVYADLTYYLRTSEHPLVVLDEAGDLTTAAFLELKALWNATEGSCGWYMMGADGLKSKIDNAIRWCKVGYAEIFSRYGGKYSRATPESENERRQYLREEARRVALANVPKGTDVSAMVNKSMEGGGLRRIRTEVGKLRSEE